MEKMIEITVGEYQSLVESHVEKEILIDGLIQNASLGWDKASLRFDDKAINILLKAVIGVLYESRLEVLQMEEEEK